MSTKDEFIFLIQKLCHDGYSETINDRQAEAGWETYNTVLNLSNANENVFSDFVSMLDYYTVNEESVLEFAKYHKCTRKQAVMELIATEIAVLESVWYGKEKEKILEKSLDND
jgi:hypothetical protein